MFTELGTDSQDGLGSITAMKLLSIFHLLPLLIPLLASPLQAATGDPIEVHMQIDAAKPQGELREIWRFFGADEPNYAYMPHGRKLLGELGELRPKSGLFPERTTCSPPATARRR